MSVTTTLWLIVAGLVVTIGVFCVVWGKGRFGCGCVNDGRAMYPCPICGFTRCAEHRNDTHDCAENLT